MKERIMNLLSMCIQAKENGFDVFFDYSPHCDTIRIEAHLPCWIPCEKDASGDYIIGSDNSKWKTSFHIGGVIYEHGDIRKIAEAETYLKGLIEDGKYEIN